ncbi:hypothetical protein CGSSp18BS74_11861 [Streptococcus pneumoniae SP18-BS74]|nr:hypothetical protein CGSSp18BS74_11861 [Streptococcus pneumoniae SP18-BS74]
MKKKRRLLFLMSIVLGGSWACL